MKWTKRIILILLLLIVIIQFFPGEKLPVTANNPGDIHEELLVGDNVSSILRSACYDCHSNETTYPWYSNVAPFSWIILHDIEEGRHELNFSEWAGYAVDRKHHKLEELIEEVEEGEMPMNIYTVMHQDADLTETQKEELIAWAQAEMKRLKPAE